MCTQSPSSSHRRELRTLEGINGDAGKGDEEADVVRRRSPRSGLNDPPPAGADEVCVAATRGNEDASPPAAALLPNAAAVADDAAPLPDDLADDPPPLDDDPADDEGDAAPAAPPLGVVVWGRLRRPRPSLRFSRR